MKRKLGIIITVSSLFIMLLVAGCSNSDSGKESGEDLDEALTLRVSAGIPETHSWYVVFFEPWMESVEEKTNGKVKFDVFSGGSLVPIEGELDALNADTIDIAMPLWPIYEPSRFPLSEVVLLPVTDSSPEIAAKSFDQLLNGDDTLIEDKTYQDYDFGKHNLKLFAAPPLPPYVLSGVNNKFDTIDSYKGSLIRSSGPVHELLISHLGGSPSTLGAADLTEAVTRGTVDGNLQAVADWRSYGFDEVLKHTVEGVYFGTFSVLLGMTEEKWESFPKDVQVAMEEAAEELLMPGADQLVELGDEIKEINIDNGGEFLSFDDFEPEVQEHVLDAMDKTWEDWIERLEKQGHPGKEVAILWRDLIIENGGDVPQVIKDIK